MALEKLYTVDEIAEYLQISRDQVLRQIRGSQLRAIKICKTKYLIRESAVIKYLDEKEEQTVL